MSQITTPDSPKSEKCTPASSQPIESQDGHDQSNAVYYTPQQEARVVRKLDLNLMTLFFFLCECNAMSALSCPHRSSPGADCYTYQDMLAFLDRSNIGNAKIAGMQKEFHIDSDGYQWLLNIFYIAYVVGDPAVILWKLFPPHLVGAVVVLGWGLMATVQAGTHSWSGLMALRFLLGAFEAAYA